MNKKTKTIIIVTAVVILLATAMVVFYFQFKESIKKIDELVINNVDLTTIEDGEYQGKCEYPPINVEVKVTVLNHQITKIVIVKHDNGRGESANEITNDVIDSQSLDVSYISGATHSSKVILKAIENALSQ